MPVPIRPEAAYGETSFLLSPLGRLSTEVLLCQFPLEAAPEERLTYWRTQGASLPPGDLYHAWQTDPAQPVSLDCADHRPDDGMETRLLRAVTQLRDGMPGAAQETVLAAFPELAEPTQHITAHLCLAVSAAAQGAVPVALSACAYASKLAALRGGKQNRVAVQLIWAALADVCEAGPEVVLPQLAAAARIARGPLEVAQHVMMRALLLVRHAPYESLEALRQARFLFPESVWNAQLSALERQAFGELGRSGRLVHQAVGADRSQPAQLTLFGGGRLTTGTLSLSLEGAPMLVLLVAYLIEYPASLLAETAEAILPPENGIARFTDVQHRVARIRQLAQRLRALSGDPQLIFCRQGRLQLSTRYQWRSDLRDFLAVTRREELGLYRCTWLEDALEELELVGD